jgi:8-oxo-dGTP pyrophosphatase MutT (NUDIX family)
LNDLIDYLRHRLGQPLPGEDAQALMIPTTATRKRFSLEARKDAKPGGVILLLYQKNDEWYFPLIQRPDYDGVHAKQMSFPGGKMDESDPDLTFTALREAQEEIGVELGQEDVIGHLSDLFIIASNFNVKPTIAWHRDVPHFIADEHEVDEIVEVKLADLMRDDLVREKPIRISYGITIQAPYFNLNNRVVWGATAMMLSEFKVILQPFFSGA